MLQSFVNHASLVSIIEASYQQNKEKGKIKFWSYYGVSVCLKLEARVLSRADIFATFIDDKTRHVWVCLGKQKRSDFPCLLNGEPSRRPLEKQ